MIAQADNFSVLTLPALRYALRSGKAQALRENTKILRLPLGHGGFLLVEFQRREVGFINTEQQSWPTIFLESSPPTR